MSHYNKQELDFVCRTKKIIEQYDKLEIENGEKFEVTLFINCMVGLLIIPQQKLFDKLPTVVIDKANWGIDPNVIKIGEKDICNVARHLRNSISHYNFNSFSLNDEIEGFEFTDINKQEKTTFKAQIKISELKVFVEKLIETFIVEINELK